MVQLSKKASLTNKKSELSVSLASSLHVIFPKIRAMTQKFVFKEIHVAMHP